MYLDWREDNCRPRIIILVLLDSRSISIDHRSGETCDCDCFNATVVAPPFYSLSIYLDQEQQRITQNDISRRGEPLNQRQASARVHDCAVQLD